MSRWRTIVGALTMTLLVLAVPAQAGPLPALSVPAPDDLPGPGDLPTGGGDITGLANEVRGEVQRLVEEQVGGDPAKTLKSVLEYVDLMAERVKQMPDCVTIDIELSPGGDPKEPKVSSGENGSSHWTKIDVGMAVLRIAVKDCVGNLHAPSGGP